MGMLLNDIKFNRIKKLFRVCAIVITLLIIMPNIVHAGACKASSNGKHNFERCSNL